MVGGGADYPNEGGLSSTERTVRAAHMMCSSCEALCSNHHGHSGESQGSVPPNMHMLLGSILRRAWANVNLKLVELLNCLALARIMRNEPKEVIILTLGSGTSFDDKGESSCRSLGRIEITDQTDVVRTLGDVCCHRQLWMWLTSLGDDMNSS
ncbi:hypothetical protein TanjilG_15689 [Lupinus angustifolius]|uniref:Uncharacterized protein n=1 Tax=Lupinus angustifolius TaxID=3871 RepID=A0A1J7HHG9_LUPAN|nr:hypothetical protein TanjilG_15689 [Lupinus angustifolius]